MATGSEKFYFNEDEQKGTMYEKGVKSLSWKDGFVSSIDGVETKNSTGPQCNGFRGSQCSAIQRCTFSQYHKSNPISKIPGLNPDTENKTKIPKSQRFQKDSRFQDEVTSGDVSSNDICGRNNNREVPHNRNASYHCGDTTHAERETERHFCDKENKSTRLSDNIKAWHEPEQEVPLIEQLIRKRSDPKNLTPVCRPDIVPVDNKGKIYFLINRNDGMITHIIKASPKQTR